MSLSYSLASTIVEDSSLCQMSCCVAWFLGKLLHWSCRNKIVLTTGLWAEWTFKLWTSSSGLWRKELLTSQTNNILAHCLINLYWQHHGLGHMPQPDNFTTIGNNLGIEINQYNCPIDVSIQFVCQECYWLLILLKSDLSDLKSDLFWNSWSIQCLWSTDRSKT